MLIAMTDSFFIWPKDSSEEIRACGVSLTPSAERRRPGLAIGVMCLERWLLWTRVRIQYFFREMAMAKVPGARAHVLMKRAN